MEYSEVIALFSKNTADLESIDFGCDSIILSKNIFKDIEAVDSEYAEERMSYPTYGLLYPTKDNRLELYVDQNLDEVNLLITLLHELVHFSDYSNLAAVHNASFRELFDDYYFLLWTEFHASYISYRFAIRLGKEAIKSEQVVSELSQKYRNYLFGNKQVQLNKFANFCFRLYGEILALSDEYYKDCTSQLIEEVVPVRFSRIFDYLCSHKTYTSLITTYGDYRLLIDDADNV